MNKGLSLLELLVIIILVGVLAVVGLTQYNNMTERARYAESLVAMDKIRKAEWMYYQKHDDFSYSAEDLILEPHFNGSFDGSCSNLSWFSYGIGGMGTGDFNIQARRCTQMSVGSGQGKSPNLADERGYGILMYSNGTLVCFDNCDYCPVNLPSVVP